MTTDDRARSTEHWTLGLAALGSFMVGLDALVVTTALNAIRLDLGASTAQLEWVVNAFTLPFAVLLITAAALGDRIGRRRMFAIGLGLFTLASAACALAVDTGTLIAARAVQGAGAACLTPMALALISAAVPPQRRGWALGVFSAVVGLAVLLGPIVGGAITEGIAWEWIFWLNVPIGVTAIALVLSRVEESRGPRTAPDLAGLALVSGAALGLMWGLVRGNAAGWGSAEVVATLAAGALLTAVFVAWERRTDHPMLPIALFRTRSFAAGNAVSFLLFAANLGVTYFVAQYQQIGLGQGPMEAGLRLLPLTVPLLFAPRVGRLADRAGERRFLLAGMTLVALGAAWLALIADPGQAYAPQIAPMLVLGTGIALAMPSCQKAVLGAVARADAGRAAGMFATSRWFGGAFGVAVAVAVFDGVGGYGSAQAFTDGYAAAMGLVAAIALCGAVVALGVASRLAAVDRTAEGPPPETALGVDTVAR